jgi:gluconolactonase
MNARRLLIGLLLMTPLTPFVRADDDDVDRFHQLVPADAKVEKLAGGMKFIEGPVWDPADGNGYLIFSDIPPSELKVWSAKSGVLTRYASMKQPNGNTIDPEGRLITCQHEARQVLVNYGKQVTLVDGYDGKRFNSPNDVVVKSDHSVWFTDPTYGLGDNPKEQTANHVFCVDWKTKRVKPVVSDFDQPNGLCFSPDEKKLYIADSGKPHHIRVFDVQPDNTLANGKVFCVIDKGIPDGIRCDEQGNVWSSAGDGVQVFAPDGKLLGKIPVPETPANLCFGGDDGKTVFITARTSLYAIKTNVKGAKRP